MLVHHSTDLLFNLHLIYKVQLITHSTVVSKYRCTCNTDFQNNTVFILLIICIIVPVCKYFTEFRSYEDTHNITQEQYADLAESVPGGAARYMTDAEALDWICSEFGFDRSKVTILHEIDEYEVNRHHQLRRTGKKVDRRPIYCATDYHYIRFNVGRGTGWMWEAWNGQLRPFYN